MLYYFGLATGLRRARPEDLDEARTHMLTKGSLTQPSSPLQTFIQEKYKHPTWTLEQARAHANSKVGRCLLILDGRILDVTTYLGEHVCRSYFPIPHTD